MPLKVGDKSPDFRLKDADGREFKLYSLEGFKLLTFYKVTCPTCQLTLPFVEKMFKSYGDKIYFLGIVQDPPKEAKDFMSKYGLTFPQLIDAPDYGVSLVYDVQVVPTIYMIDENNEVVFAEESFIKKSLEELNSKLADIAEKKVNPLFEDVSVPPFKAG